MFYWGRLLKYQTYPGYAFSIKVLACLRAVRIYEVENLLKYNADTKRLQKSKFIIEKPDEDCYQLRYERK